MSPSAPVPEGRHADVVADNVAWSRDARKLYADSGCRRSRLSAHPAPPPIVSGVGAVQRHAHAGRGIELGGAGGVWADVVALDGVLCGRGPTGHLDAGGVCRRRSRSGQLRLSRSWSRSAAEPRRTSLLLGSGLLRRHWSRSGLLPIWVPAGVGDLDPGSAVPGDDIAVAVATDGCRRWCCRRRAMSTPVTSVAVVDGPRGIGADEAAFHVVRPGEEVIPLFPEAVDGEAADHVAVRAGGQAAGGGSCAASRPTRWPSVSRSRH